MKTANIEEVVSLAEKRWPGYIFRITGNEAHGPCPICGKATNDGFVLFEDSGYFCRPGSHSGWIDEEDRHQMTEEERTQARLFALEREQRRQAKRLSALEQMRQCTDHLTYHKTLNAEDRLWWLSQGIDDNAITGYQLGVCYNAPMDYPDHRPSYTIPVFDSTWSKLLNIRHRLIGVTEGNRYLPHIKGLPGKTLFNSRLVLTESDIYLTEGAKKSIVMTSYGFPSVGVFGKAGFNLAWLKHFTKVRRLWILPDPDAQESWMKLGHQIAREADWLDVRVATLPCKPDDFFIDELGDADAFERIVKWARKVD